jgi:hypothetical protein
VILYIFISFSQSTGECVAKLGREVTWMILYNLYDFHLLCKSTMAAMMNYLILQWYFNVMSLSLCI